MRFNRIRARSATSETKRVPFTFEGEIIEAEPGDTVAAALLANGVVFTRETPISGSPRAPFCMMGACFDCLIDIDDVPNRQACMVVVTEGMVVRRMRGARG